MLGSILGAIGSVASGILGNNAAKQQQKMQVKFAKNQLQWKAEDAEKAGISKIFAMGAPTMSYQPTSVGGGFDQLGAMGQNIGNAIQQTQTPQDKLTGMGRVAQAIQLEGLQLDNELKKTQIASQQKLLTQPGAAPGIPGLDPAYSIPGQPATVGIPERELKMKTDVATPGEPALVPGKTPEVMLSDTVSGGTSPILPPAMQEALESQGWAAQMQYFMRNGLFPWFSDKYRPSQYRTGAQPGYHHRYNPITGEYHRIKDYPRYRAYYK